MKKQSLEGKKVGYLTVLRYHHTKNSNRFWECLCECGNHCFYSTGDINRGDIKSCGCYKKTGKAHYRHGLSHERIRNIQVNMIQRCENANHPNYKDYGGRGIKVCTEWHDVRKFAKWAYENGYKDNLTIDRINVNGNYEPSNCRWATRKEQSKNRRVAIYITKDGTTLTLKEWAEVTGINPSTLYYRYYMGLRGAELLSPVNKTKRR